MRRSSAIIFPEPRRVTVGEVPLPPLMATDVLIEIEYTAISPGTERWCFTDRLTTPDQDHLAFPHVPGYQAAGVVREAGSQVKDLAPGDQVFSRNCRAPHDWGGSWWGGHVGWHVADCQQVIQLPEAVSTYEAASLLLAQVGYNGASKPHIAPGDVAVVIGAGLVGQYAAQVLRHRGAHVVVTDLVDWRLQAATRCGADDVFNSAQGDLRAYVRERWPQGVDIVLETASSARTVRLATELLRYGGQLVLNGFYPAPDESRLDWHWLRTKELIAYFPNSRNRTRLQATLDLIAEGSLDTRSLVTHEFALAQAPEAYALLLEPQANFLGIVLDWRGA
ncbi:MAG: zinc-binding alcohol dehydrogenase [Anaerolineales bacterium]|nr:zinc-binding alcohol dehydrogenase [Anaerolineales bacterium]